MRKVAAMRPRTVNITDGSGYMCFKTIRKKIVAIFIRGYII